MVRPQSSKPYHHGELREALVSAGRRLLEERGIRGFTLRECARRASVSHAAPAHHFASLDDLLAEIATRGYQELTAAMESEAQRVADNAAARLVAHGVGYMAFAAANPVLFQLMFSREANRFETPNLFAAAKAAYHLVVAAVGAVIPKAPAEVKQRMVDFTWASIHGFITLVLEGQIGEGDTPRALKSRGMAMLAAVVETVVRTGGDP
ncbi:transcriptional regulator, TetR family [Enhydrobacter aerosaccus]|uniref:Transcriptional regulator, TetR family n=1 Tax=Enhydrobacter aerosaccus TaxID=225324 RepID=A0A1T4L622_9HYPH|nr:TetR/AcrR family transcriptional regulator [Enhydrobacter aerosaccus]SJZ50169.1 transcriptional regulator, TetR family [Enhydrobacter aerosaccus]